MANSRNLLLATFGVLYLFGQVCYGQVLLDEQVLPCNGSYENTNEDCQPNGCSCMTQDDCFEGEICCILTTAGQSSQVCNLIDPPPPTKPPLEGGKCPSVIKDPECSVLHVIPGANCLIFDEETGIPTGTDRCFTNEVCCKVGRTDNPCCVVVP